jgi:hypothetical protein
VLADMNNLVKLPQLGATMRVMAREMEKVSNRHSLPANAPQAGLIDEMMNESLDDMDGDAVEEEAAEEIEKIFREVTVGLPPVHSSRACPSCY